MASVVSHDDRNAGELERRLAVWEPLIGREAATTAFSGVTWYRRAIKVWVLSMIWELSVVFARGSTPLWLLGLLVGAPLTAGCIGYGLRLDLRAQRQAAMVAATSPRARPPVRNVRTFERWRSTSQYARSNPSDDSTA